MMTNTNTAYRAAIRDTAGRVILVPARKHTYHADRSAALRALDRISRRSAVNMRGFVWPIKVMVTCLDIEHGSLPLPTEVETVAL